MIPIRRKLTLKALKLFDLLVMVSAFALATIVTSKHTSQISLSDFLSMRIKVQNLIILIGFLVVWQILFSFFGMYRSRRLSNRKREVLDIFKATSIGTSVLWMTSVLFRIEMITPSFLGVFWSVSTIVIVLSRLSLRFLLSHVRRKGRNLRFLLIVGTNLRAIEVAKRIEAKPELGYRIIGFVDGECIQKRAFQENGYELVAGLKDFPAFLGNHVVDEVMIGLPLASQYYWASRVAAWCEEQGIIVRYLSDIFNLKQDRQEIDNIDQELMSSPYTTPIQGWQTTVKRLLDVVLSLALVLSFSPLFVVIGFLIKITSPGPVFFIQERLGFNKRRIRLIKFRTMVKDSEAKQSELENLNEVSGPVFKIKSDPRITPLGRFLRKTSIDELPQFINVLKGDMSLVGPRPLPVRDYEGFEQDSHRRRFSVRPGITCLWQVNGRSSISFEKWMELDMQYIDQWSLWLDFKILAKTFPAVLIGGGAV